MAQSNYTDYEENVRIQNKNVVTDFGNPVEIAKKIKDEMKADWIELSSLRPTYNMADRLNRKLNDLGQSVVIKFVIKKQSTYDSAICNGVFLDDARSVLANDQRLIFNNKDCRWWSQSKNGGSGHPDKFVVGFKAGNPDNITALQCHYWELLGYKRKEVSFIVGWDSPQYGEQREKTVYVDSKKDLMTRIGRFYLDYAASNQQIILATFNPRGGGSTDELNHMRGTSATLKNHSFQDLIAEGDITDMGDMPTEKALVLGVYYGGFQNLYPQYWVRCEIVK